MKKTIKKRAFVSAIAMLIVSAIVLTSSTFAWFTMSKSGAVESMDLAVTSPEGIQISANASTWPSTLTVDNIFDNDPNTTDRHDAYEGNVNLLPKTLFPVSSRMGDFDSNGFSNFFKVTLDADKKISCSKVTEIAGNANNFGAVAFDLFFKVAKTTTVRINSTTVEDTAGAKTPTAMRIAFVDYGNVAASATADQAIALKTKKNVYLYEPDPTNHSDDAKNNGITGEVSTQYVQSTNATNGKIDANNRITNSTYVVNSAATNINSAKSFDINGGITKMRIYIWIEGNDVDCQNSVAGSTIKVNLTFTID